MTRACVVLLSLGLVLFGTATFDAAPPSAGFGPDAARAAPPRSAPSPLSDPAADALAEFPEFDRDVLQLERAALAIRAASMADRLPDSLEKLQAYLGVASATYREQSRIADALRTAGAVIENRPGDAARALELLMTHAPYDGEPEARAALPGMLAAARDRIGGLPQDRAAELAYQADRVNAWLTRKMDDHALQAIVRDYAGTEAALQAELDLLGSAVRFDPCKRTDAFARFAEEHPGRCAAASADADGLSFFATLMNKVGGTKKRAWTVDPQRDLQRGYLETPNQPVGPSVNQLAFLNTSFPARAGHWGGWEFLTYPHVTEIQFADEARTKGRVRVTIGYSGCTVLVEKQPDGTWKATGMTDMWVT